MALTKVAPALFGTGNNITSVTVGGSANTISLTFDASGVITGASNNAVSVANTAITGNIISSQIAPDQTLNGNLTVSGTGFTKIATGTTAQRPTSNVAGYSRFNTTTGILEVYTGTAWVGVGDQTNFYSASYLVVAGGGGGGRDRGGGGGAGGLLSGTSPLSIGTVYTVTVGAGGAGSTGTPSGYGINGNDSVLGSIVTAIAGGGGGQVSSPGNSGGSGGGGGGYQSLNQPNATGGAATSGQGFAGGSGTNGNGTDNAGGGGGGASAVGGNGSGNTGGNGGAGAASSITGSSVTYAGGGGGSVDLRGAPIVPGGAGPGGGGAAGSPGNAGTANLGGGGGAGNGGTPVFNGGAGGSGVVIISIPTTNYSTVTTGTPTVTTSGANTILKFTASGTYTA